jgi:hypothetical protein
MLFYIKYGCSNCYETLVVEADNFERADLYAEQAAQECYWSYDCNYPSDEDYEGYSEEEMSEIMEQEMQNDIDWTVEPFDEKNEDHMDALRDCGAPYEI